MRYRVVTVTNNLADYPQDEADTKEFPKLVEQVEDEEETFIVDEEGNFWLASEFFYQNILIEFEGIMWEGKGQQ